MPDLYCIYCILIKEDMDTWVIQNHPLISVSYVNNCTFNIWYKSEIMLVIKRKLNIMSNRVLFFELILFSLYSPNTVLPKVFRFTDYTSIFMQLVYGKELQLKTHDDRVSLLTSCCTLDSCIISECGQFYMFNIWKVKGV